MSTSLTVAMRISVALSLLVACSDSTAPSPPPPQPPGGLLITDLEGGGSRLLEVALADSGYREYLVHPAVVGFFTVLPDGSLLVSATAGPERLIQIAPFSGEVIRTIPVPMPGLTFVPRMQAHPDGKTVTGFASWFDNTGTVAINDIDLETGAFRQLFPALPTGVSFSIGVLRLHPDGDRIFASFEVAGDDGARLLMYSRSRLTEPPETIPLPAQCTTVIELQITPDGRGLVFSCGGQGGIRALVALGLDGHPAPPIPEDLDALDVHFSPDGRFLAYRNAAVSPNRQQLWVLRLSDGERWEAPVMPRVDQIVAWQ